MESYHFSPLVPCLDGSCHEGVSTARAAHLSLPSGPADPRIRESDRVQIIPGATDETDCLVSGRDVDAIIPVPAATAEDLGCAPVGVYAQGINASAVPARNPDDVFSRIETKDVRIAARSAVTGAIGALAIRQGIDHLDGIDILTGPYPNL